MQFKFLHTADIHLGYQQYGLSERYDDFTEAFRWIIDTALDERVDFLLIAGDLFEKRTLDPRTLLIAVTEFERLEAAGIPVVAIEGNHERTYGDSLSWMEYLNQSRLLYLLDCSRHEQGWMPQPWDDAERTGGYVDIAGARIYGLKYQGAETGRALNEIGAAIAAAPPPDGVFSIFLTHTSVENYYDRGHPFARLARPQYSPAVHRLSCARSCSRSLSRHAGRRGMALQSGVPGVLEQRRVAIWQQRRTPREGRYQPHTGILR